MFWEDLLLYGGLASVVGVTLNEDVLKRLLLESNQRVSPTSGTLPPGRVSRRTTCMSNIGLATSAPPKAEAVQANRTELLRCCLQSISRPLCDTPMSGFPSTLSSFSVQCSDDKEPVCMQQSLQSTTVGVAAHLTLHPTLAEYIPDSSCCHHAVLPSGR